MKHVVRLGRLVVERREVRCLEAPHLTWTRRFPCGVCFGRLTIRWRRR